MSTELKKYRNEAMEKLPYGYYLLGSGDELRRADLVWSWTSHEWLRADSPLWLYSPLEYSEDIICAARNVIHSDYAGEVTNRRSYTLRS